MDRAGTFSLVASCHVLRSVYLILSCHARHLLNCAVLFYNYVELCQPFPTEFGRKKIGLTNNNFVFVVLCLVSCLSRIV